MATPARAVVLKPSDAEAAGRMRMVLSVNWINCGEAHRSDSMACPARKRIAAQLNQRAADICRALDEASRYNKPRSASESSLQTTASTSPTVTPVLISTNSSAPRLHDRS
jgi:hypothetical protein